MPQWRLDTAQQTLVLATEGALPQVVYWGTPLPGSEDLAALALSQVSDLTGGMLDRLPDLSLCPLPGADWQGQPGMALAEADGRQIAPRFHFDQAEPSQNALTLHSTADGLRLSHSFRAHATGVIAMQTTLHADRPVRLHWLAAPVLPIPALGTEMIDVAGKWLGELQLQRQPWSIGTRLREVPHRALGSGTSALRAVPGTRLHQHRRHRARPALRLVRRAPHGGRRNARRAASGAIRPRMGGRTGKPPPTSNPPNCWP